MENSKALATITREAVQAALTADQGPEAKLDTWENVPFTSKGDNYASLVISIKVKFKKGNKDGLISYVVKINPCRPALGEDMEYVAPMFEKEGKFYMEILPELNKLMTESGQKSLPFPKCYYAQYTKDKEMIIFEDLRVKDFKMTDRRKGMDLQHATLVIQGLGLLHATSSVMLKRSSMEDFKSRYPFLFIELWTEKMIDVMFAPSITIAKDMLVKVGGHEKAVTWIDKQMGNIFELFKTNYSSCPPFNAITHGDCWNNNVLFRYDETGLPVEVMILDLQVNRVSSLATDLNHFLFASMEGPVRKPNVDHLLTTYYATFSSVVELCGHDMSFTKEELIQEYKNKNAYGAIFGAVYVPPLVMDAEDSFDMESLDAENLEEQMQEFNKKILDTLDTNPLCKPRFVAIFDEMEEEGIFS